MRKKIVLISTGQPATNPRLVKEADALCGAGYEVEVLYCYVIRWATVFERQLLSKVSWKHKIVGGSPEKNRLLYAKTKLRFKLSQWLNEKLSTAVFAERAQARAFDEMLKAAKRIKADIYIGHNLGALPVAVKAAKHHGAKAGFDFEDYHRGEFSSGGKIQKRVVWLEKKYLTELSYLSCSSPLVNAAVNADHPFMYGKSFTLLNCFSPALKAIPEKRSAGGGSLKLFWFSQTIGLNRGLETVMKALQQVSNPAITLTLVGRCTVEVKRILQDLAGSARDQIIFMSPLPPEDLPAIAVEHDIGLANEIAYLPNRDLCLTNKVFLYLSSGLCILASDTAAQKTFLEQYPSIGFLYPQSDVASLSKLIERMYNSKQLVDQYKNASLSLALETFNWERESEKLLEKINAL